LSNLSNFSDLPVELIDAVSASLSNADILNLRTQSRTLRNGTTFEFCRRFFNFKIKFNVIGSRAAIWTLTSILSHPDFSGKVLSQALVVEKPTEKNLTPGVRTILPTGKDIDGLLAALPGLQNLTIKTEKRTFDAFDHGWYWGPTPTALVDGCNGLAPALLKGLVRKACPISQLMTLNLFGCYIDGALLSKTLVAHKHSLNQISLKHCILRDGKKAVRWLEIFRVLSQLDLDELVLDELLNPRVKICVVMCPEGTQYAKFWYSHSGKANVKHRAEGVDVGPTGFAKFSRHSAHFTESYVELGLEKLLKSRIFRSITSGNVRGSE
jgi:hypothetical protein